MSYLRSILAKIWASTKVQLKMVKKNKKYFFKTNQNCEFSVLDIKFLSWYPPGICLNFSDIRGFSSNLSSYFCATWEKFGAKMDTDIRFYTKIPWEWCTGKLLLMKTMNVYIKLKFTRFFVKKLFFHIDILQSYAGNIFFFSSPFSFYE